MAPPRRIEAALGDDDGCSTLSTLPCDKTLLSGHLDVADDDSFLDAPPPGAKGGEEGKEEGREEGTEEGAYETTAAAAAASSPYPASEALRRQSLDLARRLDAGGGVPSRTSGLASSRLPAPSAGGDASADGPSAEVGGSIDGGRRPRRTAVDPPDGAAGPDVRYPSSAGRNGAIMSRQRSPSGQEEPFFSRSDGALLAARRGGSYRGRGRHRGRGASLRRDGNCGTPPDYRERGRSTERHYRPARSRSEGGRTSIERWRESAGSDGAATGSEYGCRRCDRGRRGQPPESCDRMDGDSLVEGRRDGRATRSEGDNCGTRLAHSGRRRQSGEDVSEHCRRSWDGDGAEFRNDPHQWPDLHRWTEEGDKCAQGGSRRCLSCRSQSPDASPVRIRFRRSRSCDGRSVEGADVDRRAGSSDGVSRTSWKSAARSHVVSRMRRFSSLPRSFGGRAETAVLDDPYDEDDDSSCSSFCSSSSSSFSSYEDDERSHESSDDDEGLDGRSAMSVADAVHYLNGRRGKVTKERFRSRFLSSLSVA